MSELSERDRRFAEHLATRVVDRLSTVPAEILDDLPQQRHYLNLYGKAGRSYQVEFYFSGHGVLELVWFNDRCPVHTTRLTRER